MGQYFAIITLDSVQKSLQIRPKKPFAVPKWIYYMVVAKRELWPYKEIRIGDYVVGYEITLPFTAEELKERPKWMERVLAQFVGWLKNRDVVIVDCPIEEIRSFFPTPQNNRVHPFMLLYWFQKWLKEHSMVEQNLKVTIIDGNQKVTELVLDMIYPYLNDLRLLSQRGQFFVQKSDEILLDSGLSIHVHPLAHRVLRDAQIIINLSEDYFSVGLLEKGALFIDLSKTKNPGRMVASRRNDVFVIEDASYVFNQYCMSSKILDQYLYCNVEAYRRYCEASEYDFDDCREVYDFLLEDKVAVYEWHYLSAHKIGSKIELQSMEGLGFLG